MDKRLIGIKIQNFKSIKELQFGELPPEIDKNHEQDIMKTNHKSADIKKFPLKNISYIFAKNNLGKTDFCQALSFLQDIILHNIYYAIDIKKTDFHFLFNDKISDENDRSIIFELCFQAEEGLFTYKIVLGADEWGKPFIRSEKLACMGILIFLRENNIFNLYYFDESNKQTAQAKLPSKADSVLGLLGRLGQDSLIYQAYDFIKHWMFIKNSFDHSVHSQNRFIQSKSVYRHLNADFGNYLAVLNYYKESHFNLYKEMMDLLHILLAEDNDFRQAFRNIDFKNAKLKYFCIRLLLSDPRPRSLIILDDIFSNLHYSIVNDLALYLRKYADSSKSQLIFTGNDYKFLECFKPEEVWYISAKTKDFNNSNMADKLQDGDDLDFQNLDKQLELYASILEDIMTVSKEKVKNESSILKIKCLAMDEKIKAMYDEGISLDSLYQENYF